MQLGRFLGRLLGQLLKTGLPLMKSVSQPTAKSVLILKAYDSVICGYFCIGFIDFMLKGNNLTDFTNLFSPNNFKKNDDIISNYFLTIL